MDTIPVSFSKHSAQRFSERYRVSRKKSMKHLERIINAIQDNSILYRKIGLFCSDKSREGKIYYYVYDEIVGEIVFIVSFDGNIVTTYPAHQSVGTVLSKIEQIRETLIKGTKFLCE